MQDIWLIQFKASMAPNSSFNMDGSTHLTGIGVTEDQSLAAAIARLAEMLTADMLTLIDVTGCKLYSPSDYQDAGEKSVEIRRAVDQVRSNPGEATWACAATWGSIEELGGH